MSVLVKTLQNGFMVESVDGPAVFVQDLEGVLARVRLVLSESVSEAPPVSSQEADSLNRDQT